MNDEEQEIKICTSMSPPKCNCETCVARPICHSRAVITISVTAADDDASRIKQTSSVSNPPVCCTFPLVCFCPPHGLVFNCVLSTYLCCKRDFCLSSDPFTGQDSNNQLFSYDLRCLQVPNKLLLLLSATVLLKSSTLNSE